LHAHWKFQGERAEERLENACGIVQLAASIPNSSRNNHEFERLEREVKNLFESLFCPVTADIGEDGDLTRQLLEKLTTVVVTYHRNIRSVEKSSKNDRYQLSEQEFRVCQELATLSLDKVGKHIFSDVITQQIYPAPCTILVSIVSTYLYHEIHRNANAAYSVSGWDTEYSSGIPPWVEDLKAYIDQLSGRTFLYWKTVDIVVLAEEYLEQRRIAEQLNLSSAVEPEVEEITAEAEAFTDLSIDTNEDENRTPRNGPINSFVVLAQPAPVEI
jgi:hypothetical protein